MIPFSTSDSIRLHSDVTSAVLSLVPFLIVRYNTTHKSSHQERLPHEFPLSVLSVVSFPPLGWSRKICRYFRWYGLVGPGLGEDDMMLCREGKKGCFWMTGIG